MVTPIRGAQGEVEKLLAISRDITQSRSSQIALTTALDELKQANSTKDDILAVVSHDLRSPLTSIQGYTLLLQRSLMRQRQNFLSGTGEIPGQPDIASTRAAVNGKGNDNGIFDKDLRNIEVILGQAQRMNELIDRLLDVSRIQNGHLELHLSLEGDLVKLVREAVERYKLAVNDHQFVLSTELEQLRFRYDEARIEQILDNFISNAIKYSPAGTTVSIGIEKQPQTDGEEEQVLLWFKDEGYGISPDAQKHLFEQFYRERSAIYKNISGLGLGLYISQEIIKQHGGNIRVESLPGQGSTFYITLPVH